MLTKRSIRIALRFGAAVSLSLALYGCGRSATSSPGTSQVQNGTQAQDSDIVIASVQPGISPFVSSVQLSGQSVSGVISVAFTIAPMPNSVSSPVNVTWSRSALSSRGYLQGNLLNLPVFGLYAGYQNQVAFQITFFDESTQTLSQPIVTTPYTDPTGVYLNPTILKARAPGSTLGFSFMMLKSLLGSPVIVDTDGQIRWVVPNVPSGISATYFANGQFMVGSGSDTSFALLQFDGTQSALPAILPQPTLASFTHNIDPAPTGVLAEFNGADDLGVSTGDIVAQIAPFSSQPPVQIFDLGDILTAYMQKNGDDPTAFVRPGYDWFHVNAAAYDPSDNSVIISSRENFLIKLDYSTHDILWILGDPTKYWYTFPSLRAKALTLDAGGDYPIGQHGVSITEKGYVMIFNDGTASLNQPPGEPAGANRPYSEVTVYSVHAAAMTAHQVWNFDYGQSIYSAFCGSVYQSPGSSYLVDYADTNNGAAARIVGLDSNHNVAFDFQYSSPSGCVAAWNAIPIPMENLKIN